jgi:hypothetical protein
MEFGFVIGFIRSTLVVTTHNYYTIAGLDHLYSLHTNFLSLSIVVSLYSVSLDHTISLHRLTSQLSLTITDYHAHKTFKSHAKSSHNELSVAVFH